MIAAWFAQLFVELFVVVVVVSSWQIHSFKLLISGNLGISHCSHSCKHGWFKNVHFAQDHCKVVVFWLFNTVDEAEEIIFETLDIMEGVDGMLELDFIVVDGTSAKTIYIYETQCGKTSNSVTHCCVEIWQFSCHSDFTWNQFLWVWSLKIY